MTQAPVDPKPPPSSYAHFEEEPPGGWLRTLVQFFAIPMLIVLMAVGLYVGVRWMVGAGPRTVADFVEILQSDTINRRYQAAYELADRLREEVPAEFQDPALISALCETLKRARAEKEDVPKLAMLVLRILARLKNPAALPAVRDALNDEQPWIRSHAILALAALGDRESVPRFREMTRSDDPGTRQAALDALARLDQVEGLPYRLSPQTKELAQAALGDPAEDVRFTAALILADAGVKEGTVRVLRQMLDRKVLESFEFHDKLGGINRYHLHSNVIIKAIVAVTKLGCAGDPAVLGLLERLSDAETEGDPDVREAAREALKEVKTRD